jgi:8-oxo-dGTP pyrophosphatase MutT (NUDIX family)
MLNPEEEAEIAELARRFGKPVRWRRDYRVDTPEFVEWVNNLAKRRGEIVLVVPRPEGLLLLHTKGFYPAAVFRLPSGGIHRGERAEDAARREGYEELGFDLKLSRLLGVVENVLHVDDSQVIYPSYIFITEPMSATPQTMHPDEPISEFREVELAKLPAIARALEELPPDWAAWGKFRAAPHRLVAEALGKI